MFKRREKIHEEEVRSSKLQSLNKLYLSPSVVRITRRSINSVTFLRLFVYWYNQIVHSGESLIGPEQCINRSEATPSINSINWRVS